MPNFLTNKPLNDISQITEEMGYREEHPITGKPKQHKGIDLIPGNDKTVYSTHSGTIKTVGYNKKIDPSTGKVTGYGNYIVIQSNDGSGKSTLYAHLQDFNFIITDKKNRRKQKTKSGRFWLFN